MDRHIVFTSDDPDACYRVMRQRRLADHRDTSTLVEVRWADPPIRTVHKWAVIRYA